MANTLGNGHGLISLETGTPTWRPRPGAGGWVRFKLSRDGRISSVGGLNAPGLSWAEGRVLAEIADPESLAQARRRLATVRPGEPAASADIEFLLPDERRLVLEVVVLATGRRDEDLLISGVARDVTSDREMESMFRTLAEDSPIGVYIVQEGRFAYVNPSMERLTGFPVAELMGKRSSSIVDPKDRRRLRSRAIAMLKGKRNAPYDYRSVHADGSTRWVLETVSSVSWRGRRAVLGNYMDYTDQKELERRLRDAALHDPLTGLPNRTYLMERMDALLGEREIGLAVLFCDLDGFKDVNDRYGHAAGDRLLQAFAARLRATVREGELVARVGGDEFVVLVESRPCAAVLAAVAGRLLGTVSRPFRLGTTLVSLGLSVGVAAGVGGTDSSDALLERADETMYRAKLGGKARYVICESDLRDVA